MFILCTTVSRASDLGDSIHRDLDSCTIAGARVPRAARGCQGAGVHVGALRRHAAAHLRPPGVLERAGEGPAAGAAIPSRTGLGIMCAPAVDGGTSGDLSNLFFKASWVSPEAVHFLILLSTWRESLRWCDRMQQETQLSATASLCLFQAQGLLTGHNPAIHLCTHTVLCREIAALY